MRRRFIYGSGVVLLLVLLTLVMWQSSFNRGELAPTDLTQTVLFWAVSTLVFILTVALGFILFRTGVRLYVERTSNREGSRIQSKLFFGALALSFMPVGFLVAFSYLLLNRSVDKWFTGPSERLRVNFIEIGRAITGQVEERLKVQAGILASRPEVRAYLLEGGPAPGEIVERFRQEQSLVSARVARATSGFPEKARNLAVVHYPVEAEGRTAGYVSLADDVPLDVLEKRASIDTYLDQIDKLDANRKFVRWVYIMMQALIALFTLFVSTWIARFLAKQISGPISALLRGADEVREGNLSYRVEVGAIDELAGLVRGFNEMTRQLESNSRELDARRRFTEAILESIPTGVISLSGDGLILRVNRALKNIFPEEAVRKARRLEDLFTREDTAEIKYLMKRARRTGAASREVELKTDRQTLHLSLTVAALEEKLTSGFVLVVEDLSDLLRAQKAAAWHEVARRVAHEIKNPLTPIALSAERIQRQIERSQLPADVRGIVRECTATITAEVESVKTLVDEFSQFSRFPAAQPARADLNEVVESALAVFSGRLDGIRLHTELAGGLPAVNLDREQFKRVVVNLVDNAAEAMQESLVKELFLSTRLGAADSVELVIADTGCGVTGEDKEKLFLPYFSTKGRGTGLGLAIVNHILSDHHARIRVEDNLPAGARFTVEIPAIVEMVEESREVPAAVAGK
ncbi:MAG: HAMP domain-containing protein [Candidatus Solibacter usitatus]|nr:HAMP domain-containing protein [Candidatus Solibacter usitatus]